MSSKDTRCSCWNSGSWDFVARDLVAASCCRTLCLWKARLKCFNVDPMNGFSFDHFVTDTSLLSFISIECQDFFCTRHDFQQNVTQQNVTFALHCLSCWEVGQLRHPSNFIRLNVVWLNVVAPFCNSVLWNEIDRAFSGYSVNKGWANIWQHAVNINKHFHLQWC